MDYATESLRLHGAWKGKVVVVSRVPVNNKDQLSLAYTPGVAQPCLEIQKDMDKSYELTRRHNLVAVITDGTAIVVGAAILNALRVVDKRIDEIKMVVNGAGSAGIAIGKHLMNLGVKHLKMVDRCGILCEGADMNPAQAQMAAVTNPERFSGTLADALRGADVFVGVSAPHIVSQDMIRSMAQDAVVFPMANPVPEIEPEEAKAAGAAIVGTGRSDHPNQINNVLVFPGLFRGDEAGRLPCPGGAGHGGGAEQRLYPAQSLRQAGGPHRGGGRCPGRPRQRRSQALKRKKLAGPTKRPRASFCI